MFSIISSRTVTALFLFSFSSVLLPMDPPIVKPWKEYNFNEAYQRLQETGEGFGKLPKEILIPMLVTIMSPNVKNTLRGTNRAFSIMLSRENPQPFMICAQLCANGTDKVSLGIKMLNAISEDPSIKEKQLRQLYETGFMNYVCPIIGAQERDIRFDLSDTSKPCLDIVTSIGYPVTVQYNIHPFVQICLTRCPNDIGRYFSQKESKKELQQALKALTPLDIELLSSFMVQNNDAHSLELIHSQGIYEKGKNGPLSSMLLQTTGFCASHKVVPVLLKLYKGAQVERAIGSFVVPQTMDHLGVLLGKTEHPIAGESLPSIIIAHHPSLFNMHAEANTLERYGAYLQQTLSKSCIEKLYPSIKELCPSIEIQQQSDRKKEKKSKKYCSIM